MPNKIKDAFLAELKEQFSQVRVGNPREDGTQVGPIISENNLIKYKIILIKVLKRVLNYFMVVLGNQKDLKRVLCTSDNFINVDNQMTIAQEEIFGPVMSVITYNDLDEAIQIANDTKYGLAGYVIGRIKKHCIK